MFKLHAQSMEIFVSFYKLLALATDGSEQPA
jgi:hypothetical protein